MTDDEIRHVIADALRYASVPSFAGSAREHDFLSGKVDVPFAELEIDSLAVMELCIALEASLGVSVAPADLLAVGSLGALVRHVQELLGA